jgi:hypothetical protein
MGGTNGATISGMRVVSFLARCLLGVSLLTLPTLTARAAPDAKELSKLRAKFQQATELEQAGNYTEAITVFREVGQVKMTPQVRYHIAFCEEKLGRLLAALGGYELAEADARSVSPGFQKDVNERMEDLRARIPKLVIQRGEGAAAAKIELDGTALGSTSIGTEIKLDPGPHSVRATAPGKEPFSETVELAEKDVKTLVVKLAASEVPAVGGGVTTGGAAGGKDEGADKPPSRVLPYVIGGVGVASLAASGVFFLMRQGAISDLEDACGPNRDQCPPSKKDTYDKAKTYNTISQVTLGVGVVGVGVAATLLLTQKPAKEKPKTGLTWVPAAPNAEAGMSLYAAF